MMAHQGIGQCSTLDEMLVGTCASGAASGLQVDFVDCWSFREMSLCPSCGYRHVQSNAKRQQMQEAGPAPLTCEID